MMGHPGGPSGRRDREREEMRQLITRAARHLFVTEGYEGTTIRRIAEAIEYTPGAIYGYFEDKNAILYALHREGFVELQRHLVAAFSAGGTPGEQLRRAGEAYMTFARENPEMYHLMYVSPATARAVDKTNEWPEGKAAYEAIRALVQMAMSTGWIRPGDPDAVAYGLWSAAHGAVMLEICKRQAVLPPERRGEMATSAFTYILDSVLTGAAVPDQPRGGREVELAMPRRRRSAKES
jgi:AcrR family transcriptional regulator